MALQRTRARLVAGLGSIVALFSLMLGVQALQSAPAGNIAAHWPLDSIATGTTADVSGNGNTATLFHTPTSVAGLFGNGMQFASASTQSLTVPNSASLDLGTNSFTVGVWVKPTGTTVMRVLNKWNGTFGFHLDINAAVGGGNTAGMLRLRVKDATAHDHDYAVAAAIGAGSWKHIAGTYDRTLHQAKLYVNGVQVGATRDITTLTGALTNTTALEIGALAAAGYYNGTMDEPILYSRALTAAEIKTLAAVPQNLTASTNQVNRVTLNWTSLPGATSYNILRSATSGGPYTQIANVAFPAASYADTGASTPGTYYYVIQAVISTAGGFTSTNSNQATGISLPPQVTALPNAGLFTNENGVPTSFSIKFNQPAPAGGSVVSVSSSNTSEAVVSTVYTGLVGSYSTTATGFQMTVPAGTSPTFAVTITGVNDNLVDGAKLVNIMVTASGFTALTIPNVQCTNNDNDTPGITFSKTGGLTTTEPGGQDTFTVSLNTQPFGPITMALSSNLPTEGVVSPTLITFTSGNYNTPQLVTVTGVDDALLDFTQAYSIVSGALVTSNVNDAAAYSGMQPPDVLVENLDDEVIPTAPAAWGDNGCGLLGLEAALALVLAALGRRRRVA